jgi:hypothetical protein
LQRQVKQQFKEGHPQILFHVALSLFFHLMQTTLIAAASFVYGKFRDIMTEHDWYHLNP